MSSAVFVESETLKKYQRAARYLRDTIQKYPHIQFVDIYRRLEEDLIPQYERRFDQRTLCGGHILEALKFHGITNPDLENTDHRTFMIDIALIEALSTEFLKDHHVSPPMTIYYTKYR